MFAVGGQRVGASRREILVTWEGRGEGKQQVVGGFRRGASGVVVRGRSLCGGVPVESVECGGGVGPGIFVVLRTLHAGKGRGEGGGMPGRFAGRRDGRTKVGEREDEARLVAAEIGAELGERATLLQFSSAFCQPCRATRRVLADVAGMVEGVAHVEIDAEDRLELVRRLEILRTPTVLVLDGHGAVVRRAAGQPRKADVIAALGAAVRD